MLATHPNPRRHWLGAAIALCAVAALGGCAALNSLNVEVSSYGDWPSSRQPGTYAFERLPSQQSFAQQTALLEDAAKPALAKAGFMPVAAGQEPDVLVQLGSRIGRTDVQPWDDPLWWRGGFGYFRAGPWSGPRWSLGLHYDFSRFEHQAAVLMRDRISGKPVFEARASRESANDFSGPQTLAAMFNAALMDFPKLGLNPRSVQVMLPP